MSAQKKWRVSVVGGAGYTGGELVRLLSAHPQIEITAITSATYAGQPLQRSFPGSTLSQSFEKFEIDSVVEKSDLVFFAQENGVAMQYAGKVLAAGKRVVDLSADFRLRVSSAYNSWYKLTHANPDLLKEAVYGLPELNREKIKKAKLVANPGCFPTAATLALAPSLAAKLIDPDSIIIDAVSGVSGAGRAKFSLDYHFAEVNESVKAYGVGGKHRHTPEIEQNLTEICGQELRVSFTPHLVPITRGIMATCYARAIKPYTDAELVEIYRQYYQAEQFVTISEPGSYPATKGTYSTNQCHLGLCYDDRTARIIVVSVIDNLVKGAAGQAVQNMNLMLGIEESVGISAAGVWP